MPVLLYLDPYQQEEVPGSREIRSLAVKVLSYFNTLRVSHLRKILGFYQKLRFLYLSSVTCIIKTHFMVLYNMKKSEILLKSLWLKKARVVSKHYIEEICKKYSLVAGKMIKYMLKTKNFIKILKGFYYVKNPDEIKLGLVNYTDFEMLAEAFRLKGIKNMYFGLTSSLKMLGVTHEFFVYEDIINSSFNRKELVRISNTKFKFTKIKPGLFGFGIKKTKTKGKILIFYSDLEKTVLDYAYLKKKNGSDDQTAAYMASEYSESINKKKLKKYLKKYPASVRNLIKRMVLR